MRPRTVRDMVLGQGLPKICIPIMGRDYSQLLESAHFALGQDADMYEWRADYVTEAANQEKILEGMQKLRGLIKDSPLIFTLRSENEGGMQTLSDPTYRNVNASVIESGLADIIDLELNRDQEMIKELTAAAHKKGVHVLLSSHNFEETPPKEDIITILRRMQELDCDITKYAAMANSGADLLILLDAALAMKEKHADRPFVTVAMGEKGMLSRVAGGMFGSALTYAKGKESSAPGQLTSSQVRYIMQLLHQ